jgi:hypothetical protein
LRLFHEYEGLYGFSSIYRHKKGSHSYEGLPLEFSNSKPRELLEVAYANLVA